MHIIELLKVFFGAYWLDVLLILWFIAIAAYLIKKGKADVVKAIVYDLVVRAEATLGSGTGDLKYNMVVSQVYDRLPLMIRWLYTKKDIDNLIQWAVKSLENYLGQGKNLLTYSEELQLKTTAPEEIVSNAQLNNIP